MANWNRQAGNNIIIQQVFSTTEPAASGTTIIPGDDTIPQLSTEGDEYLTRAITPTASDNILIIEGTLYFSLSGADYGCVALFQDSTENALMTAATWNDHTGSSSRLHTLPFMHRMVAGTVSETTFKVHGGKASAGTFYLNSVGGTAVFGGTMLSHIMITEITA